MPKTTLKLLREPTDDDKVAKTKQVSVLLKHLKLGQALPREKVVDAVDADSEFVSKQGADKVLRFYTPKLVEAGLVEKVTEPDAEGEATAESKPTGKGGGRKKSAGEAKVHEDEGEEAALEGEDA